MCVFVLLSSLGLDVYEGVLGWDFVEVGWLKRKGGERTNWIDTFASLYLHINCLAFTLLRTVCFLGTRFNQTKMPDKLNEIQIHTHTHIHTQQLCVCVFAIYIC